MLGKGTILYHSNFQFKDGETGQKLLIVLNTPKKNQPYLCCKTTSKQKDDIDDEGCHHKKNIYVLNANTDWFKTKTWIQFHALDLYEFDAKQFLQAHFDGYLKIVGKLSGTTIRAIINCVKLTEDISKYHLELLE